MQLRLLPSVLHHVQIQGQWSSGVHAEGILLTEQMAGLRSGGVAGDEESAQRHEGGAQGGASRLAPAVGPQEGGQLAAGVHTAFNRQVKQQGLRLAQVQGAASAIKKYLWSAGHVQSEQAHS